MTTMQPDLTHLRTTLADMLARELRLPVGSVASDQPLTQYGLDSIAALTIAGDLEDQLALELPSTLLWDCPTIDHLAEYLSNMLLERGALAS
ncbi:acyl carrier protein [Chitinibacteraceae bacterium HSL-7]